MARTALLLVTTALATALFTALWASFWASPAAAIVRPKKEPEPKARACPEIGEGYIRIPGSDTCVRLGGSVRVEGAAISR